MVRVTAVAALLLALLAAPAGAHPLDDVRVAGDCSYYTVAADSSDHYRGTIQAVAVAYALTPEHNPVTVTDVRCERSIGGGPPQVVAGTAVGPVGVVAAPFEFTQAPDEVSRLCMVVTVTDAHGTSREIAECTQPCACPLGVPFQEEVNDVFVYTVDPYVCGALRDQAGEHGPVRITPGGDVYAGGEWIWDCPPYGS